MHKLKVFTCALALVAAMVVAKSVLAEEVRTPSQLPLNAFAQLPAMQNVELSPDGSHVAYFYPVKGKNHIVLQPIFDASSRKIIPPNGEMEFRWLKWASSERIVFSAGYSGKRWGTEVTETRLGSISRDGTDAVWIILPIGLSSLDFASLEYGEGGLAPQIQDDVIAWLPEEPDYILVNLDHNFDNKYEVRKVNINTGEYSKVRGGLRGVQNWMVDADNVARLGWGFYGSTLTVMFLNEEGDWESATRSNWWDKGWRPVKFTEDPTVVFAVGPGESGRKIVVKLNIVDGSIVEKVFDNGVYDIDGVRIDGVTGRAVGVNYTTHLSRTKYFDKEYDRLQRAAEKVFPGLAVNIVSTSADRNRLLVKVYNDTDPGVLYYWDRSAKSMDELAELMPGLTPELLSPVKPVSYAARDGYDIPGYLTLPISGGDKKLPTIVLPHGGPAARNDQAFWYLTQFLASRGYAVFQPNFRGSTGYGYHHRDAGRNEWGGLMQDDVTDGAKWLVESGVADPDRLCIVGLYYGGYVAAMGAVKTPDLYKCAASINGVLDVPRMVNDDRRYVGGGTWRNDIRRVGVSLKGNSPYHQAKRIKVPMLLVQAKDDTRVHEEQGERMAKKLRKLNKPVDYVTVDFGGQNTTSAPARKKILESLEKFLNDNIGT